MAFGVDPRYSMPALNPQGQGAPTPANLNMGATPYPAVPPPQMVNGQQYTPSTETPPQPDWAFGHDVGTVLGGLNPFSGEDFLQRVRDVLGGGLRTGLDVLGLPAQVIAKPAFEYITEGPAALIDATERAQLNPIKAFDNINEKFEQNEAPGIVKFVGEAALDPLTYVGLPEKLGGKVIADLTRQIPGGVSALNAGERVQQDINSGFKGAWDLTQGLAKNYVPLTVAKENAGSILGSVLPQSTVTNILNRIPNTYTGIPVSSVTDPLNRIMPNLGLPRVLQVPEVRAITNHVAATETWSAARNVFAQNGINITQGASPGEIRTILRDIYARPYDMLNDDERMVKSTIAQSRIMSRSDVNGLARKLGGTNVDANLTHALTLNQILQQYRMEGLQGGIDENTAIQAVGQLLGIDKANAEPGWEDEVSSWLRNKSDESRLFIEDTSQLHPDQAVNAIAQRAYYTNNSLFDLKVAAERDNNTVVSNVLNQFDNAYTRIWKQGFQKNVAGPLSTMYLEFGFQPLMHTANNFIRSIEGGGGFNFGMSRENFGAKFGGIPDVPNPLLEDTADSEPANVWDAMSEGGLLSGISEPLRKVTVDIGHRGEMAVRRGFYASTHDNQMDQVAFEKGLTLNPDYADYYAATKPLDVTQDPDLSGLSQNIANDVAHMGVTSLRGGQTSIDRVKAMVDAGLFNRNQLADKFASIEGLSPPAQGVLMDWALHGEASSEGAAKAIDEAINSEKQYYATAPEALAEKFQGLLAHQTAIGTQSTFTAQDLLRQYGQLRAMYQQYTSIPDITRMAEYDSLKDALRSGDHWRAAIHDEFNDRLQKSMDTVAPIMDKAQAQINDKAAQFGVQPEMNRLTDLLAADRSLLAKTWGDDLAFQKTFFAGNPVKRSMNTWEDPVTGFYPNRQRIWEGYYGQHASIGAQIEAANLDLQSKLIQRIQASSVANDASDAINTVKDLTGLTTGVTPNITPEAQALLDTVDKGGMPSSITNNLRKIASDNGITITGQTTPQDVVDLLRANATKVEPIEHPTLDFKTNAHGMGELINESEGMPADAEQGWQDLTNAVNNRQGNNLTLTEAAQDFLANNSLPNHLDRIEAQIEAAKAAGQRGETLKWYNRRNALVDLQNQVQGAINARITVDPEIVGPAQEIIAGVNAGHSPEQIVSAVNNRITTGAGDAAEKPEINAGSPISEPQVAGSTANGPFASGSNGTSGEPILNPDGFLAGKYRAADSFRPGIEDIIRTSMDNPAMTDQQAQKLRDSVQNMYDAFDSLHPTNKAILNDVTKEATDRTNDIYRRTFVNYDSKNTFDYVMQHVFPFWMYESQRWPYVLRAGATRPGLAATYQKYMDSTDNGYIPIGELPLQVNPLRGTVFGMVENARDPEMPFRNVDGLPAAVESIQKTFQKFGFYMGPAFEIPTEAIQGDLGGTIPSSIDLALNVSRASGIPIISDIGKGAQSYFPDEFRDYYVRMILASEGQDPDKIMENALDQPDGPDAHILDAAQNQAGMVNSVLEQTGVLRFRTPEYSQYIQQRREAIQALTGISTEQQKVYADQGLNIRQVTSLTPEQETELAALPGSREFSQLSESMLNPVALKIRTAQRDFYDTINSKRDEMYAEQSVDDQRLKDGIISGVEWRKRFQDRNSQVANMVDNLKLSPAYRNVPTTPEEQQAVRDRFNLPPYVDSPERIALSQYYSIKPETDAVTGDVNWNDFFNQREQVLAAYPQLRAILQKKLEEQNTVQVQDFKQAAQILRPYWGIKDDLLQQYPELAQAASTAQYLTNEDPIKGAQFKAASPELHTLNEMVKVAQQQARRQFPQIDQALVKYYGALPIDYKQMQQRNGTK